MVFGFLVIRSNHALQCRHNYANNIVGNWLHPCQNMFGVQPTIFNFRLPNLLKSKTRIQIGNGTTCSFPFCMSFTTVKARTRSHSVLRSQRSENGPFWQQVNTTFASPQPHACFLSNHCHPTPTIEEYKRRRWRSDPSSNHGIGLVKTWTNSVYIGFHHRDPFCAFREILPRVFGGWITSLWYSNHHWINRNNPPPCKPVPNRKMLYVLHSISYIVRPPYAYERSLGGSLFWTVMQKFTNAYTPTTTFPPKIVLKMVWGHPML